MELQLNADIAARLIAAYDAAVMLAPITESAPDFDIGAAYDVLHVIATERAARGWKPVGRKIGFTNRTIWELFGVAGPMWAHMWDRTVHFADNGVASIALAPFVQPRIEPEVVFKLRAAIPVTDDAEEILGCVEWMAPGFEIVQCPFPDWRFAAPDCTAAFGLHGALVVGAPVAVTDETRPSIARRLSTFEATLRCGDAEVDRGIGANVLDSPALALAFLARTVAEQTQFSRVAAGEIITTGTITNAWPIQTGEIWASDYGSLGVEGLNLTCV